MKSLIHAIAIAAALCASAGSFAESSHPVTRARVRAELVQLEKTGYSPGGSNDRVYPADIQAAEQHLHEQNPTAP